MGMSASGHPPMLPSNCIVIMYLWLWRINCNNRNHNHKCCSALSTAARPIVHLEFCRKPEQNEGSWCEATMADVEDRIAEPALDI